MIPDETFTTGDVVWIRSGGEAMTVEKVLNDGEVVHCIWFEKLAGGGGGRTIRNRQFIPATLTKVKPESTPKAKVETEDAP